MKRIRQFFAAIFARITKEDRLFVEKYLDTEEAKLFFAMSKIDQAHSLRVAKTAQKIVQRENKKIDIHFLTRVSLLHDVGRKKGDVKLFEKVFAVLLDALWRRKLADLAEKGKNVKSKWHFLYVYRFHAEIGGEVLRGIGKIKEAEIISKHHTKDLAPKDKENIILSILCRADEEN